MQSIEIPLNIVSIDLYKLPEIQDIPIDFVNIVILFFYVYF